LDLRKLKTKLEEKRPLDEQEAATWSHCAAMLDKIAPRDIVVVKNVPDGQHFTIVEVTGTYDFALDTEIKDFGHYLPVKCPQVYLRRASAVELPFATALSRERHAIQRTYRHADTVNRLYSLSSDLTTSTAQELPERLHDIWLIILTELKSLLKVQLHKIIDWKIAELLVLKLLEHDGMTVTYNGGSQEQGADLLATQELGYGLTTKLGVQVKYHQGVESETYGLSQLRQAFEKHELDAGLLVSFADELAPDVEKLLSEMRKTVNLEVLYGDDLYEVLLNLIVGTGALGSDGVV
jgi:hypothetical protein